DQPDVGDGARELVELTERRLGVRDLATAEAARDLHLVALLEEPARVSDLDLEVVLVGLRAQLDLFQLHQDLTAAGLRLLLLHLVLVLPEVHHLAHGRVGLRVHFDEVEVLLPSELHGVDRRHDAEHLAFGPDHTNLGDTDAVVRARARELGAAGIEAGTRDGFLPPAGRARALRLVIGIRGMMERLGAGHKGASCTEPKAARAQRSSLARGLDEGAPDHDGLLATTRPEWARRRRRWVVGTGGIEPPTPTVSR